jgi:hypothetical protein
MRPRVKEWLWRYGPAELVSLLTTWIPASLAMHHTGRLLASAIAGTWGGNIGYFGVILLRDIWTTRKKLLAIGRAYTFRTLLNNFRALVIEFGVAEVFDSFLVRPGLMYYMPKWMGSFSAGIITAKFLADLTFYLPAIVFYEWSKHRYRNF